MAFYNLKKIDNKINYNEINKRLINYIILFCVIYLSLIYIPKCKIDYQDRIMITLIGVTTFSILDIYSPSINNNLFE
jgi:hypothetical protein